MFTVREHLTIIQASARTVEEELETIPAVPVEVVTRVRDAFNALQGAITLLQDLNS